MVKRILLIFILALVNMSILASSVVSHHHHYSNEAICIAFDTNECETSCGHNHTSGDNCCSLKQNLTASFLDHRKENHCLCDVDHPHIGHLFAIILFEQTSRIESIVPIDRYDRYKPYLNLYHSVIADGQAGLRAPPIA